MDIAEISSRLDRLEGQNNSLRRRLTCLVWLGIFTSLATSAAFLILAGQFFNQLVADDPSRPHSAAQTYPKEESAEAVEEEMQKLQGLWRFTTYEHGGRNVLKDWPYGSMSIRGDEVEFLDADGDPVMRKNFKDDDARRSIERIKLFPSKSPKQFELINSEDTRHPGIYELDGSTLKLCYRYGMERPTTFVSSIRPPSILIIAVRAKIKK